MVFLPALAAAVAFPVLYERLAKREVRWHNKMTKGTTDTATVIKKLVIVANDTYAARLARTMGRSVLTDVVVQMLEANSTEQARAAAEYGREQCERLRHELDQSQQVRLVRDAAFVVVPLVATAIGATLGGATALIPLGVSTAVTAALVISARRIAERAETEFAATPALFDHIQELLEARA